MHDQEHFIHLRHNNIHVHSNLDEVHDLNSVNKRLESYKSTHDRGLSKRATKGRWLSSIG
jgi:hypothetical protein